MPETFRLPDKNKGHTAVDRAFCQDDVALP